MSAAVMPASAPFSADPARTTQLGAALTTASMLCVQLGLGASVVLAQEVGAIEIAWLRLLWAGLICAVVGRVWRLRASRQAVVGAALLGVATGSVTMFFMAAATRLPLGTVSALEFLGPLSVALLAGSRRSSRAWPLVAGAGVLLLTQPWNGTVDPIGVALALGAAASYAAYVLLTQRVGSELQGLSGLGISMPVAALVASVVLSAGDTSQLVEALDLQLLLVTAGLAMLLPVVPYALEMVALRWLDAGVFGTLVCLEPAFACLIGAVGLGQTPSALSLLGVALVVTAGIAAARSSGRAV